MKNEYLFIRYNSSNITYIFINTVASRIYYLNFLNDFITITPAIVILS